MFMIFAGDNYYPEGGMNDFIGTAATIEEALEKVADYKCDWWEIVDTNNFEVVKHQNQVD